MLIWSVNLWLLQREIKLGWDYWNKTFHMRLQGGSCPWPPFVWFKILWVASNKKFNFHWSIGEGNGTPLQYPCLENPMDGEVWKAAVHGVSEGRTRLSDFTFTFHFHALEKEMATHSSVLAWRIPGTGEPGGLPSMGSHRVEHDWSNLAAVAALIYIRT